ncbi:MAG: nucleosidase [Chloroflexi bacterium]|nr:nucleosidase [Chloroflexota bacterium]
MTVLVVVAAAEEARYLPDGYRTVLTGIGKTAAAIAVTRAILEERPSLVVNAGSAGALRDGLHGLFEIGTVVNHDMNADAIRSLGYDPRERLIVGDSSIVLASGDVFVNDPIVRARLAVDHHLVDMEGYAVAYACQELGVPLRMVKHVSDQADESAMDWPTLVDRSARELAAWVQANL